MLAIIDWNWILIWHKMPDQWSSYLMTYEEVTGGRGDMDYKLVSLKTYSWPV